MRRGELVKVLHGAYAATLLLGDRWLACRAALRVAPPGAAFSGLCAATVSRSCFSTGKGGAAVS